MSDLEKYGEIVEDVSYGVLKTTRGYYKMVAEAVKKSKKFTIVIGWDFDLETEYEDGKTFRELFESKFEDNPEYRLYVLMWSGVRIGLSLKKFRAIRRLKNRVNIVFKLATDFPFGGSHHAKVVNIDGKLVFSGGIDIVHGREDDEKYMNNQFQDASWVFRGDNILSYFKKYILKRWDRFYDMSEVLRSDLPDLDIDHDFREGKFLMSENMFKGHGYKRKNEIKDWTFELIKRAKKSIYIQNQYFASEVVRRDLKDKVLADESFDLKIMLPVMSENWLARMTIDKISNMNIQRLGVEHFFNLFNKDGAPVYIHGKVMVVDDKYLKIGSANMADRSFKVDSELDMTLIAENEDDKKFISSFQNEQWDDRGEYNLSIKRVELLSKWYHFLPIWFCELFDGRLKSFKL